MSSNSETLFNLQRLINCLISFSWMRVFISSTIKRYMKICKSNKFVFVVFEKKCLCYIFVLNAKFSIVSRTFSIAFFFVKIEILNISFDLWFLFFAQTIKRQSFVNESIKDLKIWRNSSFFFGGIIFFFSFVVLKYFCHVCSVRIADQALCLRRAVDTASTHFWF